MYLLTKMKNSLADKMYPTLAENDDTHAQADPNVAKTDEADQHFAKGGIVMESEPVVHEEVEHEPMHEVTDPEEKELLEKLMERHLSK